MPPLCAAGKAILTRGPAQKPSFRLSAAAAGAAPRAVYRDAWCRRREAHGIRPLQGL